MQRRDKRGGLERERERVLLCTLSLLLCAREAFCAVSVMFGVRWFSKSEARRAANAHDLAN